MSYQAYKKIDGSAYEHIYVVGDLHGCYDLLMEELDFVAFNTEKDLLLSVGDLIDRGPDCLRCLRLVLEPWFAAVKGNHECIAIEGLAGEDRLAYLQSLYHSGSWIFTLTKAEYAEVLDLLKICADLPIIIELNDNDFKTVIAHADYPYNEYRFGRPVKEEQIVWERKRIETGDKTEIKGADAFVFGHTPLKQVACLGNRIYIDTGAVFYGNLTLLKLK